MPSQCFSNLFHIIVFHRKLHLWDTLELTIKATQGSITVSQWLIAHQLGSSVSKGLAKRCKKSRTNILFSSDLYFIPTYAYCCENTTPQHFWQQYTKKATRWRYYSITTYTIFVFTHLCVCTSLSLCVFPTFSFNGYAQLLSLSL